MDSSNNNNNITPISNIEHNHSTSPTKEISSSSFRSISPSKILGNFVNNSNSNSSNNLNNNVNNNNSNFNPQSQQSQQQQPSQPSLQQTQQQNQVEEVIDSYLKQWINHLNNVIRGPPIVVHGTLMFNQLYLVLSVFIVLFVYLLTEMFRGWVPLPLIAIIVTYVFFCIDDKYHITEGKRLQNINANKSGGNIDPSNSNIKDKINFYEGAIVKPAAGTSSTNLLNNNSNNVNNNNNNVNSSTTNNNSTFKIHTRSSSSGSSTSISSNNNNYNNNINNSFTQNLQTNLNNNNVNNSNNNNTGNNSNIGFVPNNNNNNNQNNNNNNNNNNSFGSNNNLIGSNTVPSNLPSFINFPLSAEEQQSSTFYRTRPYDNHRRSLPPEYYNQYLNYNLNYKNNIHNQHNNSNNNINSNGQNNNQNEPHENLEENNDNHSLDQDETSTTISNDSDQDENVNIDVPKETKVELSELVNIKKVKSNITHFTKLSSNLEEKLDWAVSSYTLNPPRASHSITVYGQSIVTIGGEGVNEAANIVQFIDMEKGISSTPKVTGAKIAPDSIYLHDFCRIGNKFYLFGGMVNGKMSNKVYMVSIIDDSTVHWSQPRINSYSPSPRIGHTLTRYGNKFILFGGFDGENVLNDSHLLDPETMTWSQFNFTGTSPSERYGHSTTILGEKMIVFGGTNRVKDLNDINILQLDTNTWIPPPPVHNGGEVPPERSFHAAVRVGRNLIIVGGRREGVTQRDIWSLSYRMQWSKVTGLQISPHSHHGLVKNESQLFICGGKGQNGNILDDVWLANTTNLPISSSVSMINYPDIKIEKEIGKGHFSKVLRGVWKQKEVAVKKLNLIRDKAKEDMMNEFKAEVELLGSLQHPNLVNCFGYCLNPMCIVMEFLPTGNLFDLIHSRENKLDSTLILQFAFDIARGMRYLHSRNIIHRDLKSSNLLLDKHFNVKIADLGIARETSFTQTMTTIGTVAWTAPEILRHESYNHKADVYSYGIVIWELLTGEEPYAGIPPMNAGILVASKALRPELPENCDPNWKKLVVWCWSEDPNKRPSFEEITNYLTNTF